MPQYHVDSEQLRSASGAVSASVTQIREAVNGMFVNLNALQGVWQGSAASQFSGVAQQWRQAQQQMEQSLEAIQHALATASDVYTDAEIQASRLFTP